MFMTAVFEFMPNFFWNKLRMSYRIMFYLPLFVIKHDVPKNHIIDKLPAKLLSACVQQFYCRTIIQKGKRKWQRNVTVRALGGW